MRPEGYNEIMDRKAEEGFANIEPDHREGNVIFILLGQDIMDVAKTMRIPKEAITNDVLRQVKKGVEWGLSDWSVVVEDAINMALKGQANV